VFDRSYLDKISIARLPENSKRWLDFASAVAYPVFSPGGGSDRPVGVLLAFKCVKNGITAEDKSVLVMLARLLGIVVSESRSH
jgi:GAF domain-containing protein